MSSLIVAALVVVVGLRAFAQLRHDPRYTRRVMVHQLLATTAFLVATLVLVSLATRLAGTAPVEGPRLFAIVSGIFIWILAGTWLLAVYLRRMMQA